MKKWYANVFESKGSTILEIEDICEKCFKDNKPEKIAQAMTRNLSIRSKARMCTNNSLLIYYLLFPSHNEDKVA